MDASAALCPTCNTPFTGAFCSQCGEKRVSHHDFTVGHYLEESVEGITHFDNKFLRSMRALFRPGQLTINFEEGRKVRYMKPMQLFVICNLLFFFVAGKSNVFSHQLGTFLANDDTQRAFFYGHVGPRPDMKHFQELCLEKMNSQSKAFILSFLPFYALYTALVFWKKRKPFGLHLVFATHYFSFLLFSFIIFGLLIEKPYWYFGAKYPEFFDDFATAFNFTVISIYFVLAARRFFRVRWWASLLTGVGAGFLFVLVLKLYHFFLFYNIVRTLH